MSPVQSFGTNAFLPRSLRNGNLSEHTIASAPLPIPIISFSWEFVNNILRKRGEPYEKSDFYYDLPEELIAQTPIEPRDHSRLMQIDRNSGEIQHKHFYDLLDILQPGDLLVMNNSRVLPARLYGEKVDNGTFIEFLLLEQKGTSCGDHLPSRKKAKVGVKFSFGGGRLIGEVVEVKPDGNRIVQFTCEGNFYTALEEVGQMPLPPYIHEKLKDKERYQTVYSKELGSAAAPTAGLHFTKEMLAKLKEKGVKDKVCHTARWTRYVSPGKGR